ncbi:DUF3100 domain-containing protein [Peptoniphilus equinus]|uniref:DUF3100 domain-containing protein n=1 Tax=Peptoniphilus equinus TaxID=3016343 RepID=A0ABY7QVR8_9FIRM|nr:DUF3100 domain-containing protein [Peptoniphilus equinus]WBW50516.1 DUF3100 domain-containing protein [Peptoniphilus equinus]
MNKPDLKTDFRLHLSVLIIAIVAEIIGPKTLTVGTINIVFSPLIWSMLIMFALYMSPAKIVKKENADNANFMMGVALALLIAKLGVTSGSQLEEIKKAGLALVLQNFGNLGTIIISLPIALLLGLKRESIGMCHALSREANVGLIQDNYGAQSAEFRGVMAVYIIGTILGPIVMSVVSSIAISLGVVSPLAASMGTGAGSASMMTAGLSALIANHPDLEAQMTAFAGLSNLISSVIALPLGVFLGLPITEFLYRKFGGKERGKN